MKFEVKIKNGIMYVIRHMAGGDFVEIKTPLRPNPVRGFVRKAMACEPPLKKSA